MADYIASCNKIKIYQKMEMKNQSGVVTTSSRPLANYHPNIWGDRFLLYTPESSMVLCTFLLIQISYDSIAESRFGPLLQFRGASPNANDE